MYHFVPPKRIRKFQKYNYVKFEDVPAADFDAIRTKMEKLQSDEPLVTVGLIAYNEQNYILATLASLAETRCPFPIEIIVVNNNSTDDTQKFIDRCGVKGVRETRQGYPFARQAGLHAARGKYFISGDTDTIYTSRWVELMVRPMQRNPFIVCTYSLHAFYRDDNKYPVGLQFYQYAKLIGIYSKDVSRPQLNCGGASMAFPVETAMKFGGYNTQLVRGSDGYMALQLSDYGKIKMVADQQAVIYTNMRRTDNDGSLIQAFWIRFKYNIRYIFSNFTKQKER
ncbi:MAG TPA: glycosyl transferase family A [Cryomorphaceae bacterium]|nr:glycosyl transferase family A [Owenweeksia sp.]MBF99333.1 glycosyl transferase family A [Owenweeksia sp.]HAD98559.1 glycosyl transferase family A [Cryomorphaceae bacterium]HBF21650.1 glycosyl transferase family A [Cryomorphaceae bacterium]|tara:strand:- start:4706 stop:5551 length:846 start_codon:yes stop_codon:yes gene_type:complete